MKAPKGSFVSLFFLLLTIFLIYPFINEYIISRIVFKVFFTALMGLSLYALSSKRWIFIASICLFAPTAFFEWIIQITSNTSLLFLHDIFSFCFFCFACGVFIKKVFLRKAVDTDTIFGATIIYLFFGMAFSYFYSFIELLIPGSFQGISNEVLHDDFIYYSFVSLTTLGYGDISPVSAPAKFFSIVEAICGQLYIAVAIARTLGLYIQRQKNN